MEIFKIVKYRIVRCRSSKIIERCERTVSKADGKERQYRFIASSLRSESSTEGMKRGKK